MSMNIASYKSLINQFLFLAILTILISSNCIAMEKEEVFITVNQSSLLNALQMINIPAGNFIMGSNDGGDDEKPIHKVHVPAFKLSKNEITFELFDLFIKQTGYISPKDEGWGRHNRPVINISWHDSTMFIEWLNKVLKPEKLYRLPSEAEWEYASRAGSKTKYWWGNDVGKNKANCDNCDSQWDNKKTAPINSFNNNLFSLNDTLGNVYEWVQDCWNNNYNGAPDDGSARLSGNCKLRVVRGGSWRDCPGSMRSAYRNYYPSDKRYNEVGFRIAQSI